ncbi:MAG TPA: hypothetical protein VE549_16500 [Myxococcaceae bacterium]|nr:hypothetical protein [Myxococcaceae bacterium]
MEGWRGRRSRFALLPLVLALGAGLWFFGRAAQEREILWQLPDDRASIARVEIQLRDGEGVLVQRAEFYYPRGAPPEIAQKVRLAGARYEAQVHLSGRDGGARTWRQPLDLDGERVVAPLRAPDAR